LNVKVKALQEVRKMFKSQMEQVSDLTSEMPELKVAVTGLSNLNKAVDKLLSNILEEIDLSRHQMLELIEEISVKDAFEKSKHKRKGPTKKVSRSFLGFGKKKKKMLSEHDSEPENKDNSESDDLMVSDAVSEEWTL
jgi:hypothetical protein